MDVVKIYELDELKPGMPVWLESHALEPIGYAELLSIEGDSCLFYGCGSSLRLEAGKYRTAWRAWSTKPPGVEEPWDSPINQLSKDSERLKALIAAHPDYRIAVLAGEDACISNEPWTYCSDLYFAVGEILDYDIDDDNGRVFVSRDSLQEYICDQCCDVDGDDFYKEVARRMRALEPYWHKVIFIYATN